MANNRYAGISPFTSEQRNVFFGRDKDIEELYEQILLDKQVLLYAKSGIGKSSLLNAGVMPKLEDAGEFKSVKIRFKAYDEREFERPIQRVFTELKNLVDFESKNGSVLEQIAAIENKSLWYCLKQIQFLKPELKLILLFDQFEELFSYPEKYVTEFKNQLSEILKNEVPARFIELFAKARRGNPQLMDRQAMAMLNKSVNIKSVYIIRSDRLSELNRLRDRIPDIQKSYYELFPLDKDQAREAIVNPALKEGSFDTPKFKYDDDALEKILKFLTKDYSQQVETTQLQIICQHIEADSESIADGVVKASDIPNFKNIFFDFYNNAIADVSADKMENARKLVEDVLIRNHQRISLDGRICADYLPESELLKLVNTHLLRTERNTVGGFSYEISHDTLVAPILEARKIRVDKEEEARAEAERIEEQRIAQEKAEQERIEREKKQKQQRLIIYIISVAAIISVIFGIFGFVNMYKARSEKEKSIRLTTRGYLRDAATYIEKEQYSLALQNYYFLKDSLKSTIPGVQDSIKECLILESKSKIFNEKLTIANSLINNSREEEDSLNKVNKLIGELERLDYDKGLRKLKELKERFIIQVDFKIKEKERIALMQKNAELYTDEEITRKEIKELNQSKIEMNLK